MRNCACGEGRRWWPPNHCSSLGAEAQAGLSSRGHSIARRRPGLSRRAPSAPGWDLFQGCHGAQRGSPGSREHFGIAGRHIGSGDLQIDGAGIMHRFILGAKQALRCAFVPRFQAFLLPCPAIVGVENPVSPEKPENLFRRRFHTTTRLNRRHMGTLAASILEPREQKQSVNFSNHSSGCVMQPCVKS